MSANAEIEQYELRSASAAKAAELAFLRMPRSHYFGYFHYGDGPAAAGGGVGAFHWFPSQKALLNHFAQHLVFQSCGPASSDPFEVERNVRGILQVFQEQQHSWSWLIKELNTALRRYSQLEWIGTFRDLKQGTNDYEVKLRRSFRSNSDNPNDARPITRSEHEGWLLFLDQCGL